MRISEEDSLYPTKPGTGTSTDMIESGVRSPCIIYHRLKLKSLTHNVSPLIFQEKSKMSAVMAEGTWRDGICTNAK